MKDIDEETCSSTPRWRRGLLTLEGYCRFYKKKSIHRTFGSDEEGPGGKIKERMLVRELWHESHDGAATRGNGGDWQQPQGPCKENDGTGDR